MLIKHTNGNARDFMTNIYDNFGEVFTTVCLLLLCHNQLLIRMLLAKW